MEKFSNALLNLVSVVMILFIVFTMSIMFAAHMYNNVWNWLPPCQVEDQVNCYWDADTMGNGEGNDFVVIEK